VLSSLHAGAEQRLPHEERAYVDRSSVADSSTPIPDTLLECATECVVPPCRATWLRGQAIAWPPSHVVELPQNLVAGTEGSRGMCPGLKSNHNLMNDQDWAATEKLSVHRGFYRQGKYGPALERSSKELFKASFAFPDPTVKRSLSERAVHKRATASVSRACAGHGGQLYLASDGLRYP